MGTVVKTSLMVIAWSLVLIGTFEHRMRTEVQSLQAAHQKTLDELTRTHQLLVSTHVSEMHGSDNLMQVNFESQSEVGMTSPDVVAPAASDVASSQASVVPDAIDAATTAKEGNNKRPLEAAADSSGAAGGDEVRHVAFLGHDQKSSAGERRLPGFYSVGTTAASVGCYTFAGAATTVTMSSSSCRGASGKICTGCFIATDDSNHKTLSIVGCSTAYYKVGAQLSSTSHVYQIEIINADPTNTLTVKACATALCDGANNLNTFVVAVKDSATGYCYAGGGNRIYFQTSGLSNAATFDFTGKAITNLGTVTTADINGGTMDGVAIAGGSLDISGGTLSLAAGQVAATKVGAGTFNAGTYSFQGSVISDLGQVQTGNIDGGSIDGTTIATSDITVGSGKELDVSGGTLTLAAGQVLATKVGAGTFTAGNTWSFASSTIANLGTVTTANIDGGTIDGMTIAASDITVGNGKTLDVSGGTLTLGGGQIVASAVSYSSVNGAGTSSSGSLTLNKMTGVITADVADLGSGAADSITMTNSYVGGTDAIVLVVAGGCTGTNAQPGVIQVTPTSGSVAIKTLNHGAGACTNAYKVYFAIFD